LIAEGENKEDVQKVVTQILASGHYTYAVVGGKNEVYSWGFGENFILGSR
jgi:alpha-tubulin suppressor-like RCC1 family protein